ncbi:cell wall hydrolase [Celeribacter sp. SCSIO 80788]|uniref:cell wall hydrolase n=1 Tax=Celeribacter sp. SCSIO 80788 TaxID=3117013 RepID=UPI003DA69AA3
MSKLFSQGMFTYDQNTTPEQLAKKRQALRDVITGNGTPKYVGDGWTRLAAGLFDNIAQGKMDDFEAEKRGEATQIYQDKIDRYNGSWSPFSMSTKGMENWGTPSAPTQPMDDTRALNDPSRIGDDAMAAIGQPSGDRDLLAKTLMAEAGGEGVQGMLAAGAVIDNRRKTGGYGDGFDGVIMKPGQFSAWNGVTGYANGQGGLNMDGMQPSQDAYRVADAILSGQYQDPTGGATHYYNPAAANPAWGQQAGGDWQRIGNHVFGSADAGRGGSAQPRMSAMNTGYSGPSVAELQQALANPWLNQQQRATLQGMLGTAQQAADPMYQMQLQKAQLELQQMQNPAPNLTTGQREYEMARQQGYSGTFMDYKRDLAEAQRAQTNVNVNTGGSPGLGKLSTDYGYVMDQNGNPVIDPATGLPQAAAVPGSPAALEAQQAEQQKSQAQTQKQAGFDLVMDEIGLARELIGEGMTTGVVGGLLSNIDSTRAGALKNRLETIKANIGFDKLQAMRDASPTGGALGQVSEFENRLLQAVYGSLVQSQRSDDLLYNLDRLEKVYDRIVNQGIPDDEARSMYASIVRGEASQGDDEGWTEINGVRIREKQ